MINYREVPVILIEPQLLVDSPSDTGEGPVWDDRTQTLTWNDIPAGLLYRYHPETQLNTLVYQHNDAIGGHTLQEDGSIVIFGANGHIATVKDGEATVIVESIPEMIGSRFNDVIADPLGNVLCGSMPLTSGPAYLYRLSPDGNLQLVWDDLALSNGMGFSPDERTFYLSDSWKRAIFRADFDPATGEISNREELIHLDDPAAVPDGMTVDAAGDLWVTVWDGSCILHYAATGELIDKVPFPVMKVSSINFGGPEFRTGYVTTAGGTNRDGADGALAGSLFSVEIPGVSGKPDYRSRIKL